MRDLHELAERLLRDNRKEGVRRTGKQSMEFSYVCPARQVYPNPQIRSGYPRVLRGRILEPRAYRVVRHTHLIYTCNLR